jgi:NAD(P)-dependent dehydrogenase (short-subunit alcohol dehydrogenase family)
MAWLDGKTAVITGSTRGFGLSTAQEFARQGAAVIVSSRSAQATAHTVAGLRASGIQASGLACDVSVPEQVQALADHALAAFGRLDVWVNNAGLNAPYGPTIHVDPERFVQVTQTNVLGVYYGSLTAMRYFLGQRSGKLINILGRGERGPQPMQNAYAASKAWIKSFTLALAKEYKDSGVGVYAFSPGMMDTEMLLDVEVVRGYEDRLKSFKTVVQMLSQPPQAPANQAAWLASAATDGRTGLVLRSLTARWLAGHLLRLGLYRLAGRPGRPLDLQIRAVDAAYPLAHTTPNEVENKTSI